MSFMSNVHKPLCHLSGSAPLAMQRLLSRQRRQNRQSTSLRLFIFMDLFLASDDIDCEISGGRYVPRTKRPDLRRSAVEYIAPSEYMVQLNRSVSRELVDR